MITFLSISFHVSGLPKVEALFVQVDALEREVEVARRRAEKVDHAILARAFGKDSDYVLPFALWSLATMLLDKSPGASKIYE